jgi:hypothetical protein
MEMHDPAHPGEIVREECLNLNPAVGWGCPLCDVGWDNRGLRFRRG